MTALSYLPQVKEQYEHFPYPPRKPEDERKYIRATVTECLDALNHHAFGGVKNFHKDFRALVAGGGTGDSLICLAEQLRDSSARIVYLDMSKASMKVAQERAKVRDLTNIEWINASLLDLPKMDLGEFDYINCSGVLHHLESPEAGLHALCSVLASGGAMGIMLYGKVGRTAIYHMQDMLKLLAGSEDDSSRLDVCKRMLSDLPESNWFNHSKNWFYDYKNGDAALYDLLLHTQDRAYSIPELYDFIEGAGLNIATFAGFNPCVPQHYVKDPQILARINAMPPKQQYAIGELLAGTAKTHVFYAVREAVKAPSADELDMVPVMAIGNPSEIYEGLYNIAKSEAKGIICKTENRVIRVPHHPHLASVLKFMDGKRSLREIYKQAMLLGKSGRSELQEAFKLMYSILEPAQIMFMRHKDVPPYKTTQEMQARFK
ncbi:MAG: class I SAM-dependent methyltransferase [Alphaproteobacteria bacterium]